MFFQLLFPKVLTLFLLMIPGVIMKKTNLINEGSAKTLSNILLYITTPAMILVGFIRPFDVEVLECVISVLVFAAILHPLFMLIGVFVLRRVPDEGRKRMLTFATVFSNAGYMGMPLIVATLGDEAVIYSAVFIAIFNIYLWTLGCFIATGDRKYISVKKAFFNVATISTLIGALFFFAPIDGYVPDVIVDVLQMLKECVAPLSMILVGFRIGETGLFRDFFNKWYSYATLAARLILCPIAIWGIMKLAGLTGIYWNETTTAVILISSSTPCATASSMFAERHDLSPTYVGKIVAFSTAVSLITMPLLSLLLEI